MLDVAGLYTLLQGNVDFVAPLFEVTAEHAADVEAVHKLVHAAGCACCSHLCLCVNLLQC